MDIAQTSLERELVAAVDGPKARMYVLRSATEHHVLRSVVAGLSPIVQSSEVTNVLFVCSANRLRSPTAEQVFSTWPGIEADSAGLSNDADVVLSAEQVEWADIIFVMEKAHRSKLNRKFRSSLNGKRVICLDIPDDYEFMDPALVRILENRAGRFLSRSAPAAPAP